MWRRYYGGTRFEQLCELAAERDAGFDRRVFADALAAAAAHSDARLCRTRLGAGNCRCPTGEHGSLASPTPRCCGYVRRGRYAVLRRADAAGIGGSGLAQLSATI